MAQFTAINLSRLPAPTIVDPLDYKRVVDQLVDDFKARAPEITAIDLESEPVRKLLEVFAYREVVLRARINDAAKGVMLAYATGADLDQLAALYGVERQVITPADPDAIPPVEAVLEADDRLRQRTQLALEGFSTAGPVGAYTFHALGTSPDVADVAIYSPEPGAVRVVVLATDGVPDNALLSNIAATLSADNVRPLTDTVEVVAAEPIPFTVAAVIEAYSGPSGQTVLAEARAALAAFLTARFRIGEPIGRDGLFGALHVPGVRKVTLNQPTGDIEVTRNQFARLVTTEVTLA